MRQGQQNRRGRGRNNNNNQNRKGQNPLTRSFESTGPDVKLRGTPAHIAEKYMALARDAQSSGDPVLAENYLQHAEHYNRIIMAFREQQMAQGGGEMPPMPRHRPHGFGDPTAGGDDFGEDEGDETGAMGIDMAPQPMRHEGHSRHEGRQDGHRYEDRAPRGGQDGGHRQHHHRQDRDRDRDRHGGGGHQERGERFDRGERGERFDRGERHERYSRSERGDRPERGERPERGDRGEPRHERHERERQIPQPAVVAEGGQDVPPARREPREPREVRPAAVPVHEQPEFLRRPVRRPRREAAANGAAAASEEVSAPAPVVAAPSIEGGGD